VGQTDGLQHHLMPTPLPQASVQGAYNRVSNSNEIRPFVKSIRDDKVAAAAVIMAAILPGSRMLSQTTVTGSRCSQFAAHVSDVTATHCIDNVRLMTA